MQLPIALKKKKKKREREKKSNIIYARPVY